MNDADRLRLIRDTRQLLAGLESISTGITASRSARRRQAAATPTLRASGGGGGTGGGGLGHSDPTSGDVAASADRAARVEQELARDDADLLRAADLIAGVATRSARALRPPKDAPPPPTQRPRRCCESCARAGLEVDIYVDRYADMCRFCGDYKAAEGRRPPVAACEWKERHGKNPRADQVARWLVEERLPSSSKAGR